LKSFIVYLFRFEGAMESIPDMAIAQIKLIYYIS
jgi:hypothetical protein